MQTEITFRNVDQSDTIEGIIQKKIQKLRQVTQNIISCEVVVEDAQSNQKAHVRIFSLTIKVDVPGKSFVTSDKENQDIYALIRDGFKGMQRKLETFRDQQTQITRHHRTDFGKGRIMRLYGDEMGYGFIKSNEGDEYYFNEDNLVNADFKKLKEGEKVNFIKTQGNEGPQAMRISISKKAS